MAKGKSIRRRDFLQLSSAAVLAGLAGQAAADEKQTGLSAVEEAAKRVGQLPRRKLGYSGREVSILIGAGDLPPLVAEAGILCGMNYWHKANRWMDGGAPESIRKNRDAHCCQVCVDRVGGDHYQGRLDEEEHIAYVQEAVKKTGLGYFDDMQLHYGYHNVEEVQQNKSFVRAFERLKKQGLVKHLCLSQHSYEGSPRVKNGQSATEILRSVIEDGLYEHAQIIYSFGADPQVDRFLQFSRQKNFGVIAMKTARGIGRMIQDQSFMEKLPAGVSPHNALVRWLTTGTDLDAVVIRVKNLEEFVDTFSGADKEVRTQDQRAIDIMTVEASRSACRLCGKCQSRCPQHIPITDILRFERYALDDHDWHKASELYAELTTQADSCIDCRSCMQSCPLSLRIPEKLAKAHILLS